MVAAGLLLVLSSPAACFAQISAPSGFDDSVHCSRTGCIWVPFNSPRSFKRGDLIYAVKPDPVKDTGGTFVLSRHGRVLLQTRLSDLSASTSVEWSDDNQSFAITWSSGGAIGRFHVRVFHVDGDRVVEWPATQNAWPDFKARHWCPARGNNVQAFGWMKDNSNLLLVLSVYPTRDCGKDMGYTEGFIVDAATGEIRNRLNRGQLVEYVRSHREASAK
jgi:hypothetical protein